MTLIQDLAKTETLLPKSHLTFYIILLGRLEHSKMELENKLHLEVPFTDNRTSH